MNDIHGSTETLAEYAVSTGFERYPRDVIDRAKLIIIDTIGCALGGVVSRLGETMIEGISSSGESGSSTILGSNQKFGAATAALINGTNANALDFDETLRGLGHPSASVVPAALAVGELKRSSGKAFLNSVLVGYDVGNRIGKAIQPTHERLLQVWNVGTWQTMGAVAAAARILDLDVSRTRHAYGIAGATAPLPNSQKWGFIQEERPVHWVKEPTGWASWTGTMAALQAAKGFVGNRFILDGDKGFWIMAGSDRCDFDAMTDGLGERYEVMDLSLKPYPCCRWQHAALDCVDSIASAHDLRPQDIKSVDIYSFDWVRDFDQYGPEDMVDAEFAFPHSVTMLLHRVTRGPDWFSHENLFGEDKVEYSRRVRVHDDPEMNHTFHHDGKVCAKVKITTVDGHEFIEASNVPRGSPAKFPDSNAVIAKFLALAEPVLHEQSRALLDRLLDLESVNDIAQITGLTRPTH